VKLGLGPSKSTECIPRRIEGAEGVVTHVMRELLLPGCEGSSRKGVNAGKLIVHHP
jgi:hypothetical protein